MKRVLFAVLVVLMMTIPAFAGSIATQNPYGQATSGDNAYSTTGWRGNYNDGASAGGAGAASYQNQSVGTAAFGPAFAIAGGAAESETRAYAFSHDPLGSKTSLAGAGAVTESSALVGGISGGLFGKDTNFSQALVQGEVGQINGAGETGYPSGTYAIGGNQSGAGFIAGNSDYDQGYFLSASGVYLQGKAQTSGCTFVTVDPTGNNRSAFGTTQNSASVEVFGIPRPQVMSQVGGMGEMSVFAGKGANGAGSNGSFGYQGNTSGAGQTTNFATVQTTPHSSNVSSGGSSFAISR